MNRRESVFALVAIGLPSAPRGVGAQQPDRIRHIGFLTLRSAPNEYDTAFRDALRNLGYVENRTIQIEYRRAAGSEQRAKELAAELLARKVEVLVVATTPAIRAAMGATKTIPIVMAASADPVGTGLVASLASPGGNVTGLSLISTDTGAKRLQLLHELIPSATRITVLVQGAIAIGRGERANSLLIEQLQHAAQLLGLSLTVTGIDRAADIAGALATVQRERAQALLVQASPLAIDNRAHIVELAARHRLPAMYEVEGFVDAGGLVSYGPSLSDMYRRAAGYVDALLKGAKPADLPVELPNKYDLVFNLKTAKVLGLQIPQSLILRASRVVD
jgi:putative ABC transport system substrate-binding protein